ncbi:hypothetical protein Nepgr_016518 [Nepenthes gracilis]|uniref:Uncharacterized protein n=1 Tax=Nepenthes gracilis TaxID=150966 RepID=A0AAD3SPC7_NEPGR|nr:hypothetical protein Nepgr_016518 [Nepenthes gracilis]
MTPLAKIFTHNCANVEEIKDSGNLADDFLLKDKDQNKASVLVPVLTLRELNTSDPAALVVDRNSYVVLNRESVHTSMATVASDLSAAILRSKNIEAPVLYRGIVHSFNPVNNLELKVLRVFPSTCSANPKTKSLKAPMLIGSAVPLVTAGHARSTIRILIRFFRSKVQKAGSSTGHELFLNAAIQRIADFVVYQMGGLVGDTI